MGDAGSRAMGIFIALAVMKTGSPFLYILVALVMILDGGLGLLKVALLRTIKIHILKNVRTHRFMTRLEKLDGPTHRRCFVLRLFRL